MVAWKTKIKQHQKRKTEIFTDRRKHDPLYTRFSAFIELISLLTTGRHLVSDMANTLDVSRKTVYRYLKFITDDLRMPLEKGFDHRYFLAIDHCLFCKQALEDKTGGVKLKSMLNNVGEKV